MTAKRFKYNYKTGRICDNESNWQCTSNMRHIERRMNDLHYKNVKLLKENEQLKERNDRQAKRLAELYELMAKKDWESLTEIIDDFCSCEEQLQKEWKCYE